MFRKVYINVNDSFIYRIGVNVYIGAATILVVTLLLLFLTVSGLRAFLRRRRNSLPAQMQSHADENTSKKRVYFVLTKLLFND